MTLAEFRSRCTGTRRMVLVAGRSSHGEELWVRTSASEAEKIFRESGGSVQVRTTRTTSTYGYDYAHIRVLPDDEP